MMTGPRDTAGPPAPAPKPRAMKRFIIDATPTEYELAWHVHYVGLVRQARERGDRDMARRWGRYAREHWQAFLRCRGAQ